MTNDNTTVSHHLMLHNPLVATGIFSNNRSITALSPFVTDNAASSMEVATRDNSDRSLPSTST